MVSYTRIPDKLMAFWPLEVQPQHIEPCVNLIKYQV
jgi:hypothetical protein